MSGECGGCSAFPFVGINATMKSEEIAKAASVTLAKLNWLMKEVSDRRYDRLELESKIIRLRSALEKVGKNPDKALKPDPLVVHQREEINRLELTRTRLEDEVRRLRIELRETDEAITCSGAKRLKEKMRKIREDAAEKVRKLNDEIGHLKLRVQEAEDDSSCSALSRLRRKLREILNGDKKMERIIADVASRSCLTVIDLSNELTRIKGMLDESRLENIKLRGDSSRLRKAAAAALESAPNSQLTSGCSGYLETIERLSFHVRELERKIKEFEDDDSGLVKRLEEMEEALNVCQKDLEDKNDIVTSLSNELIGVKAAYKLKSIELTEFQDSKRDVELLKNALKERDEHVTRLQRELEISTSNSRDVERLREELKRVRTELLNLEIERDGLLNEIEKTRDIVSDRNEHIVKILEDNEQRDKARRSEIESVKTKLCIASFENERIKSRCENLEEESAALLFKLNEMKASGDSNPLLRKIKQLEEELALLKEAPNSDEEKSFDLENVQRRINELEELKARLENELSDLKSKYLTLSTELGEERSAGKALVEETENYKKENYLLKTELGKLAAAFVEEMNKLKEMKNQRQDRSIQIDDDSKLMLEKLKTEYNEMKNELNKLDDLTIANEKLNEKLKTFEIMSKSLDKLSNEFDNLKLENEDVKTSLSKEIKEKTELLLEMEKLRSKVEEKCKTVPSGKNESSQLEKLMPVTKSGKTLVMDCGDYIRADRELKYYIHLQSLAVKRVVDFISYVDGETSSKPSMATFLEPTTTNFLLLNFDENVTATFRMSQKLSQTIFQAEINVQKLETIKNERNNLKAERDCLNKGMEKLTKMLSNLAQDISKLPQSVQLVNDYSSRPFESGIELWNKILPVSSEAAGITLVTEENLNQENTKERFLEMNRRISSLQYQIKLKQQEASQKLIEMRETMRQERIQLMEIADRENSTGFTPF